MSLTDLIILGSSFLSAYGNKRSSRGEDKDIREVIWFAGSFDLRLIFLCGYLITNLEDHISPLKALSSYKCDI